jgi:trk system potassium uptake protein TrkA
VRVLIIGGGEVGGYLAGQLLGGGHTVTVVEADATLAESLGESLPALVLHGDGTSIAMLEAAEAARADWLVAVTGRDEENLVACELGATLGARRILARVSDPRNLPTFEALGIPVVAVTDLIGELIEREVDRVRIERVGLFGGGRISLIEVEIEAGLPARRVIDLDLPPRTLLVAVAGEGRAEIPGADTVIRPGDRVLAVTGVDGEPAVRAALCPPRGHR